MAKKADAKSERGALLREKRSAVTAQFIKTWAEIHRMQGLKKALFNKSAFEVASILIVANV